MDKGIILDDNGMFTKDVVVVVKIPEEDEETHPQNTCDRDSNIDDPHEHEDK